MKPTDDRGYEELIERVESLLASLSPVVSARLVLDPKKGPHLHVLATIETPVSEVSRAVMSALVLGIGFEVRADQITVVQSRLSRRELEALIGSESSDPEPVPLLPEKSATGQAESDPDSERSESNLGGSATVTERVPETERPPKRLPETERPPKPEFQRLALRDLQLKNNPDGGFGILVRLTSSDRSIGAQCDGDGTEEDSLEVPASAALGVIQEFLRSGSRDELPVMLRFLAARHVHSPEHDVVVVLVEADLGDRRIPLTGAASAHQGVERASILATLQATNAFVAGTLMADPANGASARTSARTSAGPSAGPFAR